MDGNRNRRAFLAACGLAATAGCAAPVAEHAGAGASVGDGSADRSATESERLELPAGASWPTFGGDAGNTGRRDAGPGPTGPADTAWRTDVNGIYTMPGPAVASGTVYVGSGKMAYGADARTGEPRWAVDLGELTHYFSPAVSDDGVLFAAQQDVKGGAAGVLASFTTDGTERWRRTPAVTTSPKAVDGTVFVGESTDGGAVLRALSEADGSDVWTKGLDARVVRGAPAVVDGVVYATASVPGEESGVVVALDASDGEQRWVRSLDSRMRAAPAVRDGTLFAQASDGRLFALDAERGETRWSTRLGRNAATTPALAANHLVGMVENQLVGVDLSTGEVSWRTDIGFTLINGVCVAGSRAYVGGSRLTAVDVESGAVAWEQPVPGTGGGFGAPVVVGNAVFVGVCIKEEAHSPYDDFLYAYI